MWRRRIYEVHHVVSTHEDVGERGRIEGLHVRRFDSLSGWRAERGWRTFTLAWRTFTLAWKGWRLARLILL